MAGVFFLFAAAVGVIQFAGQGARNDITKAIADTAGEGVAVVDDEGRIIYANEAYLALAGRSRRRAHGGARCSPARRRCRKPSTGSPRRRASSAGRRRRSASPSLSGHAGIRLVPRPRRPAAAPGGGFAALWTVADVTHERERQENVFQELQHAIDYLDHAPAGFLSVDPDGAIVYLNATLATWLDYDLAQVGSGGLALRTWCRATWSP